MIVDSTALPEQVVKDAIGSAFTSAGQRCSALRVLYLQSDIADRVIELIKGAMAELKVGPTHLRENDIGPVIDEQARESLLAHIDQLKAEGRTIAEARLPEGANGHFVAPVAFEIGSIADLKKEHFGPVLHVVRYDANELEKVVADINATGFGLTLGVHSRNEETARRIEALSRLATCTSTATRSAPWWVCNPSAAAACPAPGPRPAARATCCVSPTSAPPR